MFKGLKAESVGEGIRERESLHTDGGKVKYNHVKIV